MLVDDDERSSSLEFVCDGPNSSKLICSLHHHIMYYIYYSLIKIHTVQICL